MKPVPSSSERQAILAQRRNLKMAQSAHAYVRGSTERFYEWLTSTKTKQLPSGPPIWICGDSHVSNLGPVANAEGKVEIAVRDLDQTVIGNPAHDLIRLALSLATAARGSDLPGVITAQMLEAMSGGYERGVLHPSFRPQKTSRIEPIELVFRQALKRKWRHLAEERIADISPTIPKGKCFWPLAKRENREMKHLFQTEKVRKLVTCLNQRDDNDEIEIADAAYWMKGCSSLGKLRYAVLVRVGKKQKGIAGFCLVDIKEATATAAPRLPAAAMPRDNAQRIVTGAKNLSPFLGGRMLAAQLCGRSVFMRELMPQDLKLEIEELDCDQAIAIAGYLAQVLGRAHGRQMTGATRRAWTKLIRSRRSKTIDAPSWLWRSVVDLIALHEKAYLDHCRRYALQNAQNQ